MKLYRASSGEKVLLMSLDNPFVSKYSADFGTYSDNFCQTVRKNNFHKISYFTSIFATFSSKITLYNVCSTVGVYSIVGDTSSTVGDS